MINSRSVNFNQIQKPNWGSSCESIFRSLKNLSEHARLSFHDSLAYYLSRRASNEAICNTNSSKFMLNKITIYYGITRHFLKSNNKQPTWIQHQRFSLFSHSCVIILHRTFHFISATLFTTATHITITKIGLAFLHVLFLLHLKLVKNINL